ncbi:MAG: MBL fold metallo-hydrolase [Microbacterium sp. 71-36]|uniref:MBL fold metallo-hydrolase n=1 Tax=unclassified Microbacterium TaxID=2609290 RepID=UPI000868EB19|nr:MULTISPECIES: MBL fold metallo-hydrolase [unclassified Microbacterium]MBN9210930.1 MBL fold metallo-hydrolase [Microbacterium sp.]ODT38837.1 MAG: MBL fold metallo-hydrolase [Microbacterium sp. SCN 71-17]OJV77185.1 MAG: MBL fold metallo-hydrolase [Microbacterium sp. 71-36]SIR49247.1 L-ascorbate metabolism protein UlaG, beta-lactamase superfamily [Microbacterium sp. RURRCA19A]
MQVTKREHAALVLSEAGHTLVIDPGVFTSPLEELTGLVGVVITHEHADHWTPEHLTRLQKAHPGVPVYGPEGVRKAAAGFDIIAVHPGDTLDLGPFHLEFFGGTHAVIHESIPVVDNVGVLVNDAFFYPGDSYTVPRGAHVALLAAPVGAPWLKISEAIDYVLAVKPARAFATHDMTLSVAGKQMGDARLTWAVEQNGGSFVDLAPGDSTEV